jgi:nucleotide-binding universal stress UspA family protein
MTGLQQPNRVLAALEREAVAGAVLGAATRFGEMSYAQVEAVHAGTSLPVTLVRLAAPAGLELRLVAGPAGPALVAELERPDVNAIVMGAGMGHPGRPGHHPVGSTTRYVAERSTKPVVVVPAGTGPGSPFRRLLVPLEGTESSSRPVLEALLPLLVAGVEVEVLHVFTEETLPRMLDHPVRDIELLGQEFLARHLPSATRIVLRAGEVADRVSELCEEHSADMVVLSWSQRSSEGHARVVRDVLKSSAVPVMLLPVSGAPGPTALPEDLADRAS